MDINTTPLNQQRKPRKDEIDYARKRLEVNKDCFADYELEDIEKTIQSLLLDLIRYENINSAMKLIPLYDWESVIVNIGLFKDGATARETFTCTKEDTPVYISTHDLAEAIKKINHEYDNDPMGNMIHYIFIQLLLELGIDPDVTKE